MRIETERLVLRKPRSGDAEEFLGVWSDEETTRFVGGRKTRAEVEAMIERMARHWERYGAGLFAVERKHDNRVLGRIGLLLWDSRVWVSAFHSPPVEPAETEIGWTLGREYWGRGYATEGALACRDWALRELGVNRLISLIAHENAASIRVAEKIGQSFERDVEAGQFRHPVGLWASTQLEGQGRADQLRSLSLAATRAARGRRRGRRS